ncbi:MAG: tetratricopeptide repeat protein [Porticoccaceae bacterium]|nr:tetratricopeptide repeat protein [Porticoccaceae bacterium]
MELDFTEKVQEGILAHQKGDLEKAEVIYKSVLKVQPWHPDANHNLGILAEGINQLALALKLFRTALRANSDVEQFWLSYINALIKAEYFETVKIAFEQIKIRQMDVEKFENLISTQGLNKEDKKTLNSDSIQDASLELVALYDTGKYIESERQALLFIEKDPQHYLGWKMLGAASRKIGNDIQAQVAYKKLTNLSPLDSEAHYNLANTFRSMNNFPSARDSYKRAIELKTGFFQAQSNLAISYMELGDVERAIEVLKKTIVSSPNFAEAVFNLAVILAWSHDLQEQLKALEHTIIVDPDNYGLIAGIHLSICYFLENDFATSQRFLSASRDILLKNAAEYESDKIFYGFLRLLLQWRDDNDRLVAPNNVSKVLHVLGESHSFSHHGLQIENFSGTTLIKAQFIRGVKQWHLRDSALNRFKYRFEGVFLSLPKCSLVLLAIGEIDCRIDSGIFKRHKRFPQTDIADIISSTIDGYLSYILELNASCEHKIIVQGVPCPNIITKGIAVDEYWRFVEFIKTFNFELENRVRGSALQFLDVHKLTDRGDGVSNEIWHIDRYHLSPEGAKEAWSRFTPIDEAQH